MENDLHAEIRMAAYMSIVGTGHVSHSENQNCYSIKKKIKVLDKQTGYSKSEVTVWCLYDLKLKIKILLFDHNIYSMKFRDQYHPQFKQRLL